MPPATLYDFNAGVSCAALLAQRQLALPHLRRKVINDPGSIRGSVSRPANELILPPPGCLCVTNNQEYDNGWTREVLQVLLTPYRRVSRPPPSGG